ncbi:hypothetical protein ACIBEK_28135 [Nocardia fusca]|uniref:hypothetical protein n=1 Tax=Nocardia fusca TaxID=941183 RepID=UPI00378E985C
MIEDSGEPGRCFGDASATRDPGGSFVVAPPANPIARVPTQLAHVGYGCGHAASSALPYLT